MNASAMSAPTVPEEVIWAELVSKWATKFCRLTAAVENRKLSQAATPAASVTRELGEERSRLARELHAGAGQPLSGIKLNLEILNQVAAQLPEGARQALGRLDRLAEQALEQLRAVSHRLHPPSWQLLPISQALLQLIENSGLNTRFELSVSIHQPSAEPSHAIKITLYRCLQECLSNIVRHSGARAVSITFEEVPVPAGPIIRLAVSDDGKGFPIDSQPGGIGLRALREHASAMEGTCEITSGSNGTQIELQIPLDGDE